MRNCIVEFCMTALVFLFAGTAGATTYTAIFDADDMVVGPDTLWVFDVTAHGFMPGADEVIQSAWVTLSLAPASLEKSEGGELGRLSLGSDVFGLAMAKAGTSFDIDGPFALSGETIDLLSRDGRLRTVLSTTRHDLSFDSATLVVETAYGEGLAAPLPGSLLLLGAGVGLLPVVWWGRKK